MSVDHIHLVMGDTGLCPDDGGTYSSLTTPLNVPAIRQAAADHRGGALTPPSEWKVLGTPVHNVRGRDIVTGAQHIPPICTWTACSTEYRAPPFLSRHPGFG